MTSRQLQVLKFADPVSTFLPEVALGNTIEFYVYIIIYFYTGSVGEGGSEERVIDRSYFQVWVE